MDANCPCAFHADEQGARPNAGLAAVEDPVDDVFLTIAGHLVANVFPLAVPRR